MADEFPSRQLVLYTSFSADPYTRQVDAHLEHNDGGEDTSVVLSPPRCAD